MAHNTQAAGTLISSTKAALQSAADRVTKCIQLKAHTQRQNHLHHGEKHEHCLQHFDKSECQLSCWGLIVLPHTLEHVSRFVLLGATGAGKSATANVLMKSIDLFDVDESVESCTHVLQTEVSSLWTVVDTPGLGDVLAREEGEKTSAFTARCKVRRTEVFNDITTELQHSGGSIIYVATGSRLTVTAAKHLEALSLVVRENFEDCVLLVITHVPPHLLYGDYSSDEEKLLRNNAYDIWLQSHKDSISSHAHVRFAGVAGLADPSDDSVCSTHPAHSSSCTELMQELVSKRQIGSLPLKMVPVWSHLVSTNYSLAEEVESLHAAADATANNLQEAHRQMALYKSQDKIAAAQEMLAAMTEAAKKALKGESDKKAEKDEPDAGTHSRLITAALSLLLFGKGAASKIAAAAATTSSATAAGGAATAAGAATVATGGTATAAAATAVTATAAEIGAAVTVTAAAGCVVATGVVVGMAYQFGTSMRLRREIQKVAERIVVLEATLETHQAKINDFTGNAARGARFMREKAERLQTLVYAS
eukprot:11255-Heterococcus_DN1.PRE.2